MGLLLLGYAVMARCIVDGRFTCVGCGACRKYLEAAKLRLEEKERVAVAFQCVPS